MIQYSWAQSMFCAQELVIGNTKLPASPQSTAAKIRRWFSLI